MNIAEKLEAIAAEIEEHPERWTQGPNARNRAGESVSPDSPDAVAWCAVGFQRRENILLGNCLVCDAARRYCGAVACSTWNDAKERKPAEVAALFRKAAQIAKESPQ